MFAPVNNCVPEPPKTRFKELEITPLNELMELLLIVRVGLPDDDICLGAGLDVAQVVVAEYPVVVSVGYIEMRRIGIQVNRDTAIDAAAGPGEGLAEPARLFHA